jgi:molybdopterin molybdotransferase
MLLSETEVLAEVLTAVSQLETESISLWESAGRVLARDLFAGISLPRFDNSSMDGYAVRARDAQKGARLKVMGEQSAGPDFGLSIEPGFAIRIFTGAPIPTGADAVIMQEDVNPEGDNIIVREGVDQGENIRLRGGDLCEGQRILDRGSVLMAPQLALIASQGLIEVDVFKRPRVAIIATGTELKSPGEKLAPGEIYETNRILLSTLAANAGAVPRLFDIVPDRPEIHLQTFRQAMQSDVVIVAGGVSVGEKDLVKSTLAELGLDLKLWRVAIRPGKPFLFGTLGRTLIFGLPGNPVSAFVTFVIFVRKALLKMSGRNEFETPRRRVRLRRELRNLGDRPHYLRGTVDRNEFDVVGTQESHALFTLAQANALYRLEPNQVVPALSEVDVIPLIF